MDNNNNIVKLDAKFVGYAADRTLKNALKNRTNPMALEDFFKAINQTTATGGCSCCKQDNLILYAVYVVGIKQIRHSTLSLCSECCSHLPTGLRVVSIDSNGAPPTLIYNKEV